MRGPYFFRKIFKDFDLKCCKIKIFGVSLCQQNERDMITKGTEEYKMAQQMAGQIERAAKQSHVSSYFEMYFEQLSSFLNKVMSLDCFAAQVAKTIDSKMDGYSYYVASVSSKQAWILACAAVENNIEF